MELKPIQEFVWNTVNLLVLIWNTTAAFLSNRMASQWAVTLVEIRGTLADIRGTTK